MDSCRVLFDRPSIGAGPEMINRGSTDDGERRVTHDVVVTKGFAAKVAGRNVMDSRECREGRLTRDLGCARAAPVSAIAAVPKMPRIRCRCALILVLWRRLARA